MEICIFFINNIKALQKRKKLTLKNSLADCNLLKSRQKLTHEDIMHSFQYTQKEQTTPHSTYDPALEAFIGQQINQKFAKSWKI